MNGPQVQVIAATVIHLPALYSLTLAATADQDQGTDMARLIECAGRTCYSSYGKGRGSAAFHQHLKEVNHLSVIEHASLSFFISSISRGCSHELVRHRVGTAISQRSTRYVDESESEWAWHPAIERARGRDSWPLIEVLQQRAQETYRRLVETLEPEVGRKQARGAARGVLGNALATELVLTMNLRAVRHFLELRATDAADAEIRLLANRLYEAAQPYCPEWISYPQRDAADGIGWVIAGGAP